MLSWGEGQGAGRDKDQVLGVVLFVSVLVSRADTQEKG